MATKKQKREAAEAKHEAYMEELRQSGLAALKKERARRERKKRDEWQENHDKNHNWKKRIVECPHCQDILKASKKPEQSDKAS